MSPDEEDRNSYFAIDVYRMGRGFFVISTCLTLAGLYFAAHPHYLDETHTSNRTAYVIKNYKTYPNGSMYYEFPEEDGTISTGGLGPWFKRLLNGEYRFSYGNAFWNYCRLRTVPNAEWMSSPIRSMNHLVLVQVFFRTAVLLTMTHSLLQCILINFISKGNCSIMSQKIIGFPMIIVELAHNVSLFVVSCLQYEQDSHLIHFSRMAIILLTVTTVLKLIFCAILQSNQMIQVGCVLLSAAVILSHNSVLKDFDSFITNTFCDSMTYPAYAIAQLIYFLAFFVTGYLQHETLSGIRIVTCSTPIELEHQKQFCDPEVERNTYLNVISISPS